MAIRRRRKPFRMEKWKIFLEEEEEESEKEVQKIEEGISVREEEESFGHMPGFANFKLRGIEANKVNIFKKGGNWYLENAFYGTQFNVFEKGIYRS